MFTKDEKDQLQAAMARLVAVLRAKGLSKGQLDPTDEQHDPDFYSKYPDVRREFDHAFEKAYSSPSMAGVDGFTFCDVFMNVLLSNYDEWVQARKPSVFVKFVDELDRDLDSTIRDKIYVCPVRDLTVNEPLSFGPFYFYPPISDVFGGEGDEKQRFFSILSEVAGSNLEDTHDLFAHQMRHTGFLALDFPLVIFRFRGTRALAPRNFWYKELLSFRLPLLRLFYTLQPLVERRGPFGRRMREVWFEHVHHHLDFDLDTRHLNRRPIWGEELRLGIGLGKGAITEYENQGLASFLTYLTSVDDALSRKVKRALFFFNKAWEDELSKRDISPFLYLIICLESLLVRDREQISSQLKDRTAFLLGRDKDERKHLTKSVSELYDRRSRLVHDGSGDVPEEEYKKAKELAAQALHSSLELAVDISATVQPSDGKAKSKELFFERLDDLKYG